MTPSQRPPLTLISFSGQLYSTKRLLEAATLQSLSPTRVDPTRVLLRHGGPGAPPVVTEDGRPLPVPEVILPRVGSRMTPWSLALMRTWMAAGARSPVKPGAIGRAMDKIAASQRLAARGLPVLPTVAIRERWHIEDALNATGGDQWVLKTRSGTQGRGVVLAPTRAAARSMLEVMIGHRHDIILVQPYVRMTRPRDLRVLVLGGEAVAACWRSAPAGEFRANVHRGGAVSEARLDDELAALAQAAAAAVEVPFCGVDLMETPEGWVVLEVNGSPGLEGIEAATGRDLATAYVKRWMAAARAEASEAR
ncbi:MAG: 30S ribosomal protein S6--L-glutamate ligase [Proteobacteria bacterium]|nr:MAG: 30S ribosomal protein S6--L-glutamate ligase [Pseudomonadota bacterium]